MWLGIHEFSLISLSQVTIAVMMEQQKLQEKQYKTARNLLRFLACNKACAAMVSLLLLPRLKMA